MVKQAIIPYRKIKYKKERRKKGISYLSAKKMKICKSEIKYSNKTIRLFIEGIAKPSLKHKKIVGDVYKGHMALIILNYCVTQYSENDLKSLFGVKKQSSLKNLKIGARELSWFIRNKNWNPKITSEFKQRSKYSYENFGNVGGMDFRHVTWNIDGKPIRSPKFKKTDSEGKKLSHKELNKHFMMKN